MLFQVVQGFWEGGSLEHRVRVKMEDGSDAKQKSSEQYACTQAHTASFSECCSEKRKWKPCSPP